MKEWSQPKVEKLDVVNTSVPGNGNAYGTGNGNPNGTGNGGNGLHIGWGSVS